MGRSEAIFQPDRGRAQQQHAGREAGRIHLLDRGKEDRVRARGDELGAILVEGARILLEVLMRRELRRVDENRDDDASRMAPTFRHERDMAFMQGAHGRNQRDLFAGRMPAADRFTHGRDRLENRDPSHNRLLHPTDG